MSEKTNGFVSIQKGKHRWLIPVYAEIENVCIQEKSLYDPPIWDINVLEIIHIGHKHDERLSHDCLFDAVTEACHIDNMAFDIT